MKKHADEVELVFFNEEACFSKRLYGEMKIERFEKFVLARNTIPLVRLVLDEERKALTRSFLC